MPKALGRITAAHDVIYPRYDPAKFVGREWLVKEVARFRDSQDWRQLIIVGEPGSGKSAFLAYLAETWNCPRHFIRADNIAGVTGLDPRAFFISLGWQLHQKYGSDIFANPASGTTKVTAGWTRDDAEVVGRVIDELHTLPFLEPAKRQVEVRVGIATGASRVIGERVKKLMDITLALNEPTLLRICVLDPLQKIAERYPQETVVILIDALDESIPHTGGRIVDVIPSASDPDFPPNLRLVMTTRIVPPQFRAEDCLFLDDREKGHLQQCLNDAREYINKRLTEPPLSDYTAGWPKQKLDELRTRIEKGSDGGNFLYLYHFLNELAEAAQAGTREWDAITVPKGLDGIYRFFAVEKIKSNAALRDWVELYLPLLGTLAVVREPVSREQLARFAGVDVAYVDFIVAQILQFLDVTREAQQNRYRLYHSSFSEYLLDKRRNRDYPLDGPSSHYRIASSCRPTNDLWSNVDWSEEKDPYVFRNLAAHLAASNHQDELYELVAAGKGWAEAHFGFSRSYVGYVSDLEQALAWTESPEGWSIGRQVHCAVIKSSVHSLAGNLPPSLLSGLVEAKLWTPLAAVAHLEHILNEEQRAETLLRILPLLDDDASRLEAIEVTRQLSSSLVFTEVLKELVRCLPETLKPELLALVRGIKDDNVAAQSVVCAHALGQVMKELPDALKHDALEIARQLEDNTARVVALLQMVPAFPEPTRTELLEEARKTARGILDPKTRVMNLGWLTTRMIDASGAGSEEFFAAAQAIADPAERVQALLEPGRFLPDRPKAALMQQLLQAARQITDPQKRADHLLSSIEALPAEFRALPAEFRGELSNEALEAILGIKSPWSRAVYLVVLAGYVSGDLQIRTVDEAVDAIGQIDNSPEQIRLLGDLCPYVPEPRRSNAVRSLLDATRDFADEEKRAGLVRNLAPLLPADLRIAAWDDAKGMADLDARVSVLDAVIEALPAETRDRALQQTFADAKRVSDPWKRALALRHLAPLLPGDIRKEAIREALQAIRLLDQAHWPARMLRQLAPLLQEDLKKEAYETARAIVEPGQRADALIGISAILPLELRTESLRAALAATRWIGDEKTRAEVLGALASLLPETAKVEAVREARIAIAQIPTRHFLPELKPEAWSDAITAAALIEDPQRKAQAFCEIAAMLPDERKEATLEQSFVALDEIVDEGRRAETLLEIGKSLTGEWKSRAVAFARRLQNPSTRGWALQRLAGSLSNPQQAEVALEALESTKTIQDPVARAKGLCDLMPLLPESTGVQTQRDVLDLIMEIGDPGTRVRIAAAICDHLPADRKTETLIEALETVKQIKEARSRVYALRTLAPCLMEELKPKAFELAAAIDADETRIEAVVALLSIFPTELKIRAVQDLLAWARKIEDDQKRAEVLRDLAPHLPGQLCAEVLAAAREICTDEARALALAWLVPGLPEHLKSDLVAVARQFQGLRWRAIVLSALAGRIPIVFRYVDLTGTKRTIQFRKVATPLSEHLQDQILLAAREMVDPGARAFVLLTLAPHLSDPVKAEVLGEVMDAVKQVAIASWGLVALPWSEIYAEIVACWETIHSSAVFDGVGLWHGMAHALGSHPRPQLMSELASLAPLIKWLGSTTALTETFHAIRDVSRWYP